MGSPSMPIPLPALLTRLLQTLASLLNADLLDLVRRLSTSLLAPRCESLYEVLDYDARLELRDPAGKKALYTKRARVRFLQDNVVAYQDQAWGDGDIFAAYRCSPGIAVDRYREGHRWRVLISLRGTRNCGDIEEFHIERTIRDGFTRAVEDFQTEVDHTTHRMALSVVFPRARLPKQVLLIEQHAARSRELGPAHRLTLPDGRALVRWETDRPRRCEAYIVRWVW